jgi:hypothetical protein
METSCATIFSSQIRTAIREDCAMSSHLTELGQEAVAAVWRHPALVKCQLLASMPIELRRCLNGATSSYSHGKL